MGIFQDQVQLLPGYHPPGLPKSSSGWGQLQVTILAHGKPKTAVKDQGARSPLPSWGAAPGRACPGLALQLRPPPWDVLYQEDLLKGQRSPWGAGTPGSVLAAGPGLGHSMNPHCQLCCLGPRSAEGQSWAVVPALGQGHPSGTPVGRGYSTGRCRQAVRCRALLSLTLEQQSGVRVLSPTSSVTLGKGAELSELPCLHL